MLHALDHTCILHQGRVDQADPGLIHVVFGVDKRFSYHAMVTLVSVLETNPGRGFHFHFISFDALATDLFEAIPEGYRVRCALSSYQVPNEVFSLLPESPHFPKSACLRLLAPLLLRCHPRLLYLDADIVCLDRLDALWPELDANDAVVAVVEDCPQTAASQVERLGLAGGRYFNSGVLYIHTARWLAQGVTERVLAILQAQGGALRFPDQDALNLVLEGHCRFMAQRYNQQLTLSHGSDDAHRPVPGGTVLLHYTGLNKPWQAWNEQAAVMHYRRLRAVLPWAGEPFDTPSNARQARLLYKLCFRQGRWLRGFYWLGVRWRAAFRAKRARLAAIEG